MYLCICYSTYSKWCYGRSMQHDLCIRNRRCIRIINSSCQPSQSIMRDLALMTALKCDGMNVSFWIFPQHSHRSEIKRIRCRLLVMIELWPNRMETRWNIIWARTCSCTSGICVYSGAAIKHVPSIYTRRPQLQGSNANFNNANWC